MNVSIFHDMTCKQPLPGLLEGVANIIRTDEKLAVFTRSYRISPLQRPHYFTSSYTYLFSKKVILLSFLG